MDFPAKNPSRMAGVVHFQLALSNYSWSWGWTTQRRIAKPSVASGKPLRPLMVVVNSLSSSPKKWLDSYLWLFMGFGHCWPSTLGACWPFWGGKTDDQARSLVANNLCSPPSASGNEGCQTNQEFGCQQLFSRAIGLHSCRPGASVKRMSNGFIPTGLEILCSSGSSLITKIAAGQSSCDFHDAGCCWLLYWAVGVGSQGCHEACLESAAIFSKEAWQWWEEEWESHGQKGLQLKIGPCPSTKKVSAVFMNHEYGCKLAIS